MATSNVEVQIIYNNFDTYGEAVQRELDIISLQAAERTIEGYRARAREDTGSQIASAYITGNGESTYSEAVAEAQSLNPKAQFFPEEQPDGEHMVVAAVAARHSVFNEFGGHNHDGDGVFTQSVEEQRQWFLDEARKVL